MGMAESRSLILGNSEAQDPYPGGEKMVLKPKLTTLRGLGASWSGGGAWVSTGYNVWPYLETFWLSPLGGGLASRR